MIHCTIDPTSRRRLDSNDPITVIKPSKGDKFVRGSNLDIEWKIDPSYKGKWVHLYLMRGSEFFETLVGHTGTCVRLLIFDVSLAHFICAQQTRAVTLGSSQLISVPMSTTGLWLLTHK
jgi:hypothetical protein